MKSQASAEELLARASDVTHGKKQTKKKTEDQTCPQTSPHATFMPLWNICLGVRLNLLPVITSGEPSNHGSQL